jgi:hypothetical protein
MDKVQKHNSFKIRTAPKYMFRYLIVSLRSCGECWLFCIGAKLFRENKHDEMGSRNKFREDKVYHYVLSSDLRTKPECKDG